jgi:glutaminyl-peptide cyclotransferase
MQYLRLLIVCFVALGLTAWPAAAARAVHSWIGPDATAYAGSVFDVAAGAAPGDEPIRRDGAPHSALDTSDLESIEDGEVLARRALDSSFFGEGLALVDDRLIQLTWRSGIALVSDLESLEQEDMLRYPGEGWGLCFDGSALVMSDGSSILELRDPDSMELLRELTVWRGDRPVPRLNELECVGDDVYANVWQSDEIVRIDPATGRVTAVIDASGLLSPVEATRADVLNGIAYRPETETFLLTGKLWPHVFEVELVRR